MRVRTVRAITCALHALAGLAVCLVAETSKATEISGFTISTNIGLSDEYVSRGFALNWERPVLQAGIDVMHETGWYVGSWASPVTSNFYANGTYEIDLYVGHRGNFTDELSYDAGIGSYFYPGANYSAAWPSATYPNKRYDTSEATLSFSYKWFNLKYSHSMTDYFGYNDRTVPISLWNSSVQGGVHAGNGTRGSGYLEANVNFDLWESTTLVIHAARQNVAHSVSLSYNDYKVSLSKRWEDGWSALLGITTTQGASIYNDFLSISGNGQVMDIAGPHILLGINKAF